MNIKHLRPLAISAVLVAGLSLTACGGDDEKAADPKPTDTTSQSTDAPTDAGETELSDAVSEAADDASAALKEGDLAAFAKAQEAGLDSLVKNSAGMFKDITITTEGNKLVYTYVIADNFPGGADAVKSVSSSFQSSLDAAAQGMDAAGIKDGSMQWIYETASGDEIVNLTSK